MDFYIHAVLVEIHIWPIRFENINTTGIYNDKTEGNTCTFEQLKFSSETETEGKLETSKEKLLLYFEYGQVLSLAKMVDLANLNLSPRLTLKSRKEKHRKTSGHNLSSDHTTTMYKVVALWILVHSSYLIIVKGIPIILSSTSVGLLPTNVSVLGLGTYQLYLLMVKTLRGQQKFCRKKRRKYEDRPKNNTDIKFTVLLFLIAVTWIFESDLSIYIMFGIYLVDTLYTFYLLFNAVWRSFSEKMYKCEKDNWYEWKYCKPNTTAVYGKICSIQQQKSQFDGLDVGCKIGDSVDVTNNKDQNCLNALVDLCSMLDSKWMFILKLVYSILNEGEIHGIFREYCHSTLDNLLEVDFNRHSKCYSSKDEIANDLCAQSQKDDHQLCKSESHDEKMEDEYEIEDSYSLCQDQILYRNTNKVETNCYSNRLLVLKNISSLEDVENDQSLGSEANDIHEQTNVKVVCTNTECNMDEMISDSPELSLDELHNSCDVDDVLELDQLISRNQIVETCTDGRDIYESTHLGRNFQEKVKSHQKPFGQRTEPLSEEVILLETLNPDTEMDKRVKYESHLKCSLSESDLNSLKDYKGNVSVFDFCSGMSSDTCPEVYNCQYEHHQSFEKQCKYTKPIDTTVIDLQKNELNLEKNDGKKLPVQVLERSDIHKINKSYIADAVRDAMKMFMNDLKKDLLKLGKSSSKKFVRNPRHNSRRQLSRRRLRRIIYGGSNFTQEVDIEARPILGGQPNVASGNITVSGSNQLSSASSSASFSQSEVAASQPETPSSLKTYFTQKVNGHDFTKEEMMMFEMLRVQSFQDLPASCDVSPLRLAASGFFSTGIGDEVTCVSCGVKYRNWTCRDNPKEVHRNISPDCRMVNGTETRNIPVHPQTNGHVNGVATQQETIGHLTNGFAQSTPMYDGAVSTQTANQNGRPSRDEMERPYTADNTRQTQNVQHPVSAHQFTQPQTDRSNTISETQKQPTQPQRTNTLSDAQSQPAQPQRTNALSGSQNGQPAQRDIAEDLGITLDRPKYPAYAQLNVRMSTFQGWPGYLDQTPRDMALAGFFYAGYNDYCRCFFCGGGLRNWDAGDDPWVEHARWFSKCAFVLQNRGRRFVEIIMRRQAEMQASGNLSSGAKNQTAITAQSETSSRQNDTPTRQTEIPAENASSSQPGNVSAAAIQSVKEMGCSEENIQKAIAQIRQNHPYKETIDATDILNIIFTLTEDNTETNTSVPSENTSASALNLPSTSLPTPQATVAGQQSKSGQPNQAAATKSVTESQPSNAQNAEASLPSLSVSSLEQINKTGEVVAVVAGGNSQMSENDIRSIQEENIQLKEQVMCKICMDKNVSIAFLPCGHLACCIDCAPAMRKCPMCRVFIKGTVKTYLA